MLNPRRFQGELRFFHLNSGLADRTWRTKSVSERWRIFCAALSEHQYKTDFTAHGFVLMGTHFHILFSTRSPKEHILAEEFHQKLNELCGETAALEEPLFCDPIRSAAYYRNAYKYIYRNPVEAGLCRRVEDYEFSSLKALLGGHPEMAPVIDNMGLIYGPAKILAWLNQAEPLPQGPNSGTSYECAGYRETPAGSLCRPSLWSPEHPPKPAGDTR